MEDITTLTGWLLVAGPVLGLAPVANPKLMRIWSMPHDSFVAEVGRNQSAWQWLNGGFVLATIVTTGGLASLAFLMPSEVDSAAMLVCASAYGIGGALWCAVLAMRTRTVPLLATLGDTSDSPGVAVVEAATGGLFQAFVLITSVALAAVGGLLLTTGVVASVVAVLVVLSGVGGIVWLLSTGDVIPAVLYLPTLLVGVSLLAGW